MVCPFYRGKITCVTKFKPREHASIDFLGFTHYWRKNRRGSWSIRRKTMKSRLARAVKAIGHWCRSNRHKSLPEQYVKLCSKIRGHYAYFGIRGNSESLGRFLYLVRRLWIKWLRRRSQRYRLSWGGAERLLQRYPLLVVRLSVVRPAKVMN